MKDSMTYKKYIHGNSVNLDKRSRQIRTCDLRFTSIVLYPLSTDEIHQNQLIYKQFTKTFKSPSRNVGSKY